MSDQSRSVGEEPTIDPAGLEPSDDTSLRHRIVDAAIEAELATGRREETLQEAKRHILLRILNVVGGGLVFLVGVAMLALPGPGWLVIFAGLAIMAPEVPFAARLMEKVRKRLPQDADGNLPVGVFIVSGLLLVAGLGASIWWYFIRGA